MPAAQRRRVPHGARASDGTPVEGAVVLPPRAGGAQTCCGAPPPHASPRQPVPPPPPSLPPPSCPSFIGGQRPCRPARPSPRFLPARVPSPPPAAAREGGWEEVAHTPASRVIGFRRRGDRLNVYYTTGPVGTAVHPPPRGAARSSSGGARTGRASAGCWPTRGRTRGRGTTTARTGRPAPGRRSPRPRRARGRPLPTPPPSR